MRYLLFLLCQFSFSLAYAQLHPFEQQLVVLANGEEHMLWISLDEQADQLFYKEHEQDKAEIYSPAAITSFTFDKKNYYSLPLREGYYTFFEVFHEGEEFAVLDKSPNYKIFTQGHLQQAALLQRTISDKQLIRLLQAGLGPEHQAFASLPPAE